MPQAASAGGEEALGDERCGFPVFAQQEGAHLIISQIGVVDGLDQRARNGVRGFGETDQPVHGFGEFGSTARAVAHLAGDVPVVMMLAGAGLRVVPVTIHVPLRDVPGALTPELLRRTITITSRALTRDFGLPRPRIAVAGLNPHAGEGGRMGDEETTLITPVLDDLRRKGLDIAGPLSADTMFHPSARARYDVAICMYHDQALIPLKTVDFAGGVNVTLGLPFPRTSPDHGTALDIAGKGVADPASMIAAIRMAAGMARRRA